MIIPNQWRYICFHRLSELFAGLNVSASTCKAECEEEKVHSYSFFMLYYRLFYKIVLAVCIYWCSAFLCGLTFLSFQSVCADGDILLFRLIKWTPAVECRADPRVRWFERPRDLLVCLICSVAGNMLTAVFLRLALVSSCFCRGQSHFVFLVSVFRLFSFLATLSTFCYLLSPSSPAETPHTTVT